MKSLIPYFIHENYQKNNFDGIINADVMFVDISGFSAMTQNLMQNGNEGAEILSEIINDIFTPAIAEIYSQNGFISTFAGDAFTAIFPTVKTNSILLAAVMIQKKFRKIGTQNTKFGTFKLQAKIGISSGNVNWRIITSKAIIGYYFRGQPINQAAICEAECKVGKIAVDQKIFEKCSTAEFSKMGKYYHLNKTPKFASISPKIKQISDADLQPFILDSIIELKSKGEFRNVLSCFISFENSANLDEKITKILNLIYQHGGYLNKIDFGDKGAMMLVLFGAPIVKDKIYHRAFKFALAVNGIKNFKTKIGMTYYTAFTGFIGSELRCEYTALGMSVNLAARFMVFAKWNTILIDRYLFRENRRSYEIEFNNETLFKGFDTKISSYKLLKIKDNVQENRFVGKFVGRKKELNLLNKHLEKIKNSQFGGMIFVDGSAGIGKSRLVFEFEQSIPKIDFNWFNFPCDNILSKSFYPVIYFLEQYFNQSERLSKIENKIEFEKKIDWLYPQITDDDIKAELLRTKSLLGALLNIFWENSLFEKLDKKSRFELTLLSLKNLVKCIAFRKPLILQIEDYHNIDFATKSWLKMLVRDVDDFPFMVISTCQSNQKNEESLYEIDKTKLLKINLDNLSKSDSNELIKSRFGANFVPSKTSSLIFGRSYGNPFFIEQLVFYLVENKKIDSKFHLISDNISLPNNIRDIIMTLVDRLSYQPKEVVKVASVMGNDFSKKILKEVLQNIEMSDDFDKSFVKIEEKNIWRETSKFKHQFNSAIIRESIYDMQMKKQVRELHLQTAKAIKKIYKNKIQNFYPDLAYNYEKGEDWENTVKFLELAGNRAKESYYNDSAVEFYDKLLIYLKDKKNDHLKINLKRLEILLLIGKSRQVKKELSNIDIAKFSEQDLKDKFHYLFVKYFVQTDQFEKLSKYVDENIKNVKSKFYANTILISYLDALRYLNKQDEFEKLADELTYKITDNFELKAKLFNTIGFYHSRKSEYEKALDSYQKSFENASIAKNNSMKQKALHGMGIAKFRLGERKLAKEFYLKALSIVKEIGDQYANCLILTALAQIEMIEGKYDIAIKKYLKALHLAKNIANKKEEGLIYYSLAQNYEHKGQRDRAIEYLEKAKEIFHKIQFLVGLSYANDLHGDILFALRKFKKAKTIYLENLKFQKTLKDRERIAHTYGNLGNVAKIEKNYIEAEKYYKKQQSILVEVGDVEGEGKAWFNWAMIEVEQNNFEQAKIKLEKAIQLFEKCSFKMGVDLAKQQLEKYFS